MRGEAPTNDVQRSALALAGLALLLASIAWLAFGRSPARSSDATRDAGLARSSASSATIALEPPIASESRSEAADPDVTAPGDAKVAELAAASFGPQLEIRLVAVRGGAPIPDAELFAWTPPQPVWGLDPGVEPIAEVPSKALVRLGERHAADASGVVLLERSNVARLLLARSRDGRAALEYLDPSQASPVTLALARSRHLDVVVRDEDGRAVPALDLRLAQDGSTLWSGFTDERGRASIDEVDLVGADAAGLVDVIPCVPGIVGLDRWCSLDAPGPIELSVPRGGAVRVRFVDEAGELLPLHDRLRVDVTLARGASAHLPEVDAFDVLVEGGVARLAWVPESVERFDVRTHGRTYQGTLERAEHAQRGARALWPSEIDVLVDASSWFGATLVDAAGAPLAERELRGWLLFGSASDGWGRNGRSWRGRSDARGRILVERTALDWQRADDGTLVLVEALSPRPRWASAGRAELNAAHARGERFPALVLAPAPIALAGRVVDEDGRPVRGAVVRAKQESARFPGETSLYTLPLEGDVVTDADGRFTLHAPPIDGGLQPKLQRAGKTLELSGRDSYAWGSAAVELHARVVPPEPWDELPLGAGELASNRSAPREMVELRVVDGAGAPIALGWATWFTDADGWSAGRPWIDGRVTGIDPTATRVALLAPGTALLELPLPPADVLCRLEAAQPVRMRLAPPAHDRRLAFELSARVDVPDDEDGPLDALLDGAVATFALERESSVALTLPSAGPWEVSIFATVNLGLPGGEEDEDVFLLHREVVALPAGAEVALEPYPNAWAELLEAARGAPARR